MSSDIAPSRMPDPAAWTLAKFIISGGSAAALFFVFCYLFAKAGAPPFAATIVAYGLAFAIGYGLQRGWTFNAQHRHGHAFPRYLALQIGCGLLSGVVSQIAVADLGWSPLPMSLMVTLIAGGVSCLGSRFWVFPHHGTRVRLEGKTLDG